MKEIVISNIQPAPGMQSSTVKIDQKIEGPEIEEFYAYFTPEKVTLTRLSTRDGNHPYGPISADIMDALCDAWECFKVQCEKVELEERWRVKKVLEQVDAIVAEYPEIEIEESKYGNYKIIRAPKIGFYRDNDTSPDDILFTLTEAKEAIDAHKAAYEKAMDIKDKHPEIIIKAQNLGNGRRNWMFSIPDINYSPGLYYQTSIELLEALQCGVAMLEEHQSKAAQSPDVAPVTE